MTKVKRLVIGLTGPKAAGKDELAKILCEKYGFKYISLSTICRDVATKRHLPHITTILQNIGDELRLKYGPSVLAKRTVKKIQKQFPVSNMIINGIRNPWEVKALRKSYGPAFTLVALNANKNIRLRRYLKREGVTKDQFEIDNERDLGKGEKKTGQQVKKCLKMADLRLKNNYTRLSSLNKLARSLISDIKNLK